jgi:hypothetical protein
MRTWTAKNITSFPTQHKVITPSDTAEFQYPTAIYVISAGDVAIADKYNNVITYPAVPAFTLLPVMARKVMATNTTSTSIVGIFGDE